uniref:Uncharacterized protein n=1 Tax=Steinernema glaseri TaxID=37863 RepID=A0A1I7ZAA7_9BILA
MRRPLETLNCSDITASNKKSSLELHDPCGGENGEVGAANDRKEARVNRDGEQEQLRRSALETREKSKRSAISRRLASGDEPSEYPPWGPLAPEINRRARDARATQTSPTPSDQSGPALNQKRCKHSAAHDLRRLWAAASALSRHRRHDEQEELKAKWVTRESELRGFNGLCLDRHLVRHSRGHTHERRPKGLQCCHRNLGFEVRVVQISLLLAP